MSLARLAGIFTVAGAAALNSACTIYPVIGRHGNIGIGVSPAYVPYAAPVYVPAPTCVAYTSYGQPVVVPCGHPHYRR